MDIAGLSRAERMAFYINIYNQLIVRTPAPQLHKAGVCACALDMRANLHAHICIYPFDSRAKLHAVGVQAPGGSTVSRMG